VGERGKEEKEGGKEEGTREGGSMCMCEMGIPRREGGREGADAHV